MKNKFTRALSLFLCLILFASTFVVFASAEEEGDAEKIDLILNRDFDEGWDFNGFTNSKKDHNFYVDREIRITGEANHFLRLEFGNATGDGYISLKGTSFINHTVLGFRIMFDDKFTYSTRLAYSQISSNNGQNSFLGTTSADGKPTVTAFGKAVATPEFGSWVRLVYDFDWTAQSDASMGDCTVYVYDEEDNLLTQFVQSGVYTLNTIRIGKMASGNYYGQSFCLDDIYLYNSETGAQLTEAQLDANGYGSKVNVNATKPIDVTGGNGSLNAGFLSSSIAIDRKSVV